MKKMLDPSIYNRNYFLSERTEGYREYTNNKLSPIRQEEIRLLKLCSKDKIIDIGCGRGDIVRYLSLHEYEFVGLDYSQEAINVTRSSLPEKKHSWIVLGDAKSVKFPDENFTKAIIGDVIEHMSYDEALRVINEAYRLLKKDGKVVVHTAPNLWFKKYVYPFVRIIFIIMGKRELVRNLDKNIKATYKYHVDEYSPASLKKLFEKSNFTKFNVRVHPDALRTTSDNYLNSIKSGPFFKVVSFIINRTPLINFFGNDLLVVATKG